MARFDGAESVGSGVREALTPPQLNGGCDPFDGLERITNLVRGRGNGLSGSIGTLTEGVARVDGARADIAIAEILPGGIEILPRVIRRCIAGGQAQHGGKGQIQKHRGFHKNGSGTKMGVSR